MRHYYEEKGNPRSLDLLFRVLFGVSAEVEFPEIKSFSLFSDAKADTRPKIVLSNYQGISSFSANESYEIKQTVRNDPTTGFRASAFLDSMRVVNNNGTNFIHADLVQVKELIFDVDLQISDSGGTTKFENVIPSFFLK